MKRKPTYNELLEKISILEGALAGNQPEANSVDGNYSEVNIGEPLQRDQWLSYIINHGSDVHFIHDSNYILTFISPQCEAVFGYTVEEMYRDWRTLISDNPANEEGRRKAQEVINSGTKQEPYLLEAVRKDGRKIWIEIEESPISSKSGRVDGVVGVARDITSERENREELIKLRSSLKIIHENVNDIIWQMDAGFIFTYVSPAVRQVMGCEPAEIIGQPVSDFMTKESLRKFSEVIPVIQKAGEFKNAAFNQYDMVAPDGRVIAMEVSSSPVYNYEHNIEGYSGISRDIRERLKVEEVLKESEERYRSLVTNISELIIEIDAAGKFTYLNDRYLDILGYLPDELIGQHVGVLIHPDDLKVSGQKFQSRDEESGSLVNIWRLRHKQGIYKTFECRSAYYLHLSGEMRTVIIAYDITERINRERENKDIRKRLNRAEKVAKLGHWQLNMDSRTIIGSEGALDIYGLEGSDLSLERIQRKPLQEYRAELDTALKDLISHGKPYDLEFRILRESDGRILDIHSIAEYNRKHRQVFGVLQDITEQKKTERELKASEERFRKIIENNPVPIIITGKDKNIISFNRKFTQTFGYSLEDVKDTDTLWRKTFPESRIRKYKQQRWMTLLDEAKKQGTDIEKILQKVHCKDGSVKKIEFQFVSLGDENIISMFDLTELVNIQQALEESEEKLRLAIQASGYALFELNIQDREAMFSSEFLKMLGYKDSTELKVPLEVRIFAKFVHPDDNKRVFKRMYDYFEGRIGEYRDELRLTRADGGSVWVMSRGKVVSYTPEGEPERMLGVLADITPIKDYEMLLLKKNQEIAAQNEEYAALNEELQATLEELRKTNVNLEAEKEKAQESDRLKSAFLANMSHEIRTPMNSILGFSELLAQDDLEVAKRNKFASLINNSGEQLMHLINDIIDISKIESNQMRIEKNWCRINELLEEILVNHRQHRNFLEKNDLVLRFSHPDKAGGLSLFTDSHRLTQIFDNLINNAVKFTDKGFVEIGYTTIKKDKKRFVEFYVSDSGTGIPSDSLNKIFIRFIQADNPSRSGGTGLGLSITKGLVELLGGSIMVESVIGEGSVFRFTHPMEVDF